MKVPALALAPLTRILSKDWKWPLTSKPVLTTTARAMRQLKARKAAKPFRSVRPRQPVTMPLTMERNWKMVSLTRTLFCTFSGSTN